jgi:hypothetical protein
MLQTGNTANATAYLLDVAGLASLKDVQLLSPGYRAQQKYMIRGRKDTMPMGSAPPTRLPEEVQTHHS